MEQAPIAENVSEDTTISSRPKFFPNIGESPMKIAMLLLGAIIVLGLIASGIFFATSSDNQDIPGPENESESGGIFESVAPYSFIYGYWEGNSSHINSANLSSGEIVKIATLPFNIKKVSIISPTELIFINNTDIRDHGREIAMYNTEDKDINTAITASEGFGIDDYVVSPSKRYIAIWEVSIPPNESLSRGRSRVYSVDLQNIQAKNLIYDENLAETTFATYPVAITDTGEIFFDTFKPNSGSGWANGMYVSNFTGESKTALGNVVSGTYSTQPTLSPDGRYLAFAGYDGSEGDGVLAVGAVDGFRKALITPNTIDLLDTTTRRRIKLPGITSADKYPEVYWDSTSNKIIYTRISDNTEEMGQYIYDINTSIAEKVSVAETEKRPFGVLTTLNTNTYFVGLYDDSNSTVGNLGAAYSNSLSTVGIYNEVNKEYTNLNISNGLIQSLGFIPSNYFSGDGLIEVGRITTGEGAEGGQLQLGTFVLKPTLEPVRIVQQSEPAPTPENDVPTPSEFVPQEINKPTNCVTDHDTMCMTLQTQEARGSCLSYQTPAPKDRGCMGSPLYLYGEKGQKVSVSVNTEIYNSNIPSKGLYKGILTGNGGINILGNIYRNIDFDYSSALKILPRLEYGRTVRVKDVGSVLHEYGNKLGLNNTEIEDTVKKLSEEQIDLPYVFISFFDDETSKAILPITFNPEPDVYRNIVFYLKPTNMPVIAKNPQFEHFERKGFTAVEVSYILDR